MARHAPLLFTVAAVLAVAAASASAYVRAADNELMIIGGDDDVFGLGGVIGGRRRLDDLNGTSPDANATSADANSTSTDNATAMGYISYLALSRDSVPCSQRGASYYNCQPGAEANPYTRGCSAITQCRG
ncbi:protein RALF-like 33 [Panicum miliaceum]|uniref:Protein RALF-like 33 n=1 Tax=Panicum miliaceum TaxID=4540 RepID=A0A3L6TC56_PANMI|nr:protein RALF-like 33 [Panicum miliaceum]